MTPAREQARDWIAGAPHLIDVLDWHRRLCTACDGLRYCPEYHEIIEEYGAGVYGLSVFSPPA